MFGVEYSDTIIKAGLDGIFTKEDVDPGVYQSIKDMILFPLKNIIASRYWFIATKDVWKIRLMTRSTRKISKNLQSLSEIIIIYQIPNKKD